MLAESSPAAIDKFQAALEKNAFHHRAFGALVMMQVTLGRLDNALDTVRAGRRIFPTDQTLVLLEAVIFAFRGERESALGVLSQAQITEVERKAFALLIEFAYEIARDFSIINGQASLLNHYQRGMALILQNNTVVPVMKSGLHFPPVIAKAFLGFPNKMLAAQFGVHQPLDEAMANMSRVHPEGIVLSLEGHKFAAKRQFAKAIPHYQKALEGEFVIPHAKKEVRHALMFSLVAEALFGGGEEGHPPKEKSRLMNLAVGQIRQIEPDPKLVKYYLVAICRALQDTKQFDLLRVWLDTWEKKSPDNTQRIVWKLKLEMQTRNYRSALELADHLLKSNPQDKVATEARVKILEAIQAIAETGSADEPNSPMKAGQPKN